MNELKTLRDMKSLDGMQIKVRTKEFEQGWISLVDLFEEFYKCILETEKEVQKK